jgi:hypothetical protein
MKPFIEYTLLILGLDLITVLLICWIVSACFKNDGLAGAILIFFLICGFGFMQLIVALILLNSAKQKLYGQAMLLSLGIYLLIGLSICGIAMNT